MSNDEEAPTTERHVVVHGKAQHVRKVNALRGREGDMLVRGAICSGEKGLASSRRSCSGTALRLASRRRSWPSARK